LTANVKAGNHKAALAFMELVMDRNTALKKIAEEWLGGHKACAEFLGFETVTQFRNRLYEIKGQRLSLDQEIVMSVASDRDEWIQSLCEEHGGVFVRLPEGEVDRDDLLAKFNELYAEIGMLSTEFREAVSDEEVDHGEKEQLSARGVKINAKVQELLALTFSVYCRKEGGK
jgi:hypothetical protein